MRVTTLLREHGIFFLLFSLAAILRLAPLTNYQFTYDEISALQRIGFSNFGDLIREGVRIDAHPALVQVVIYYLTQWFGISTWIIKLPFLILGLAAIPYAYAFCRRNLSQAAANNAIVIFSFSLLCMYYAPIARMYGCGLFFSIALLYHFFELLFHNGNRRLHLVLFILYMLLGALNHHINALFAATVYLSGFFYLQKRHLKQYILAAVVCVLLYLPHLPITLYQLSVGGIGVAQGGWLEPPRATSILDLLNILCGTGYGLVIVIVLAIVSAISGRIPHQRGVLLLPVLFVVNFLIIFLYSLFRAPIYQHSLMIFAGSGLLIYIANLLTSNNTRISYLVTGLLFVWFITQTIIVKDLYRHTVKTIHEYQFERVTELREQHGSDLFPVFMDADSVMRRIYFDKYKSSYDCLLSTSPELSSLSAFTHFVDTTSASLLALASSQPLHQAIVREKFPYLVENTQTQAIHFKIFSRRDADRERVVPDDSMMVYDHKSAAETFSYPDAHFPLLVDSPDEYPYHINAAYGAIVSGEGQMILAEAEVQGHRQLSGVECCISITDQAGNVLYYNAGGINSIGNRAGSTKWVRGQLFIGNLHHLVRSTDLLNIYIWNRRNEHFLLLGLTVKVVDHWPDKWHFWD